MQLKNSLSGKLREFLRTPEFESRPPFLPPPRSTGCNSLSRSDRSVFPLCPFAVSTWGSSEPATCNPQLATLVECHGCHHLSPLQNHKRPVFIGLLNLPSPCRPKSGLAYAAFLTMKKFLKSPFCSQTENIRKTGRRDPKIAENPEPGFSGNFRQFSPFWPPHNIPRTLGQYEKQVVARNHRLVT